MVELTAPDLPACGILWLTPDAATLRQSAGKGIIPECSEPIDRSS
jgi:hypothetical protein